MGVDIEIRNPFRCGCIRQVIKPMSRGMEMKQIYKMSRKQVAEDKGSKPTQAEDQSHKPAKHIEETARLASSIEPKKDPEKVCKAKD
jgi:hypothetical protein